MLAKRLSEQPQTGKRKAVTLVSYGTCEEIKNPATLELRDLKWWSISAIPECVKIAITLLKKHDLALVKQKIQCPENGTKWHLFRSQMAPNGTSFSRRHIMPTATAEASCLRSVYCLI